MDLFGWRRSDWWERVRVIRARATIVAVVISVVSVPAIVLLHLANRLSIRRTLGVVRWISSRRLLPEFEAREIGMGVNAAARLLGLSGTSCLARSQLIWLWLRWTGRTPVVRVGAAQGMVGGGFAHAWTELDGMPVGDSLEVATQHPPFDQPLLVVQDHGTTHSV